MRVIWYILAFFCGLAVIGAPIKFAQQGGSSADILPFLASLFFAWLFWRMARRQPVFPFLSRSSKPQGKDLAPPEERSETAVLLCAILFEQGPEAAKKALEAFGVEKGMDADALRREAVTAFPFLVEQALEDDTLTEEEEEQLAGFLELMDLHGDELPQDARTYMIKAALIRDLLDGKVQPRAQVPDMPFNLMKKETLVWAYPSITAYEHKTQTEYVAGSRGTSIRIAKGVYWRVGVVKGRRVQREVQERLGSGPLAVTSRHIYYHAGNDSFRIKHDKIVSIIPTSESVIVNRDGARNKPLELMTDDPWFLTNIMSNARNWA